jgi:hypothetical protein
MNKKIKLKIIFCIILLSIFCINLISADAPITFMNWGVNTTINASIPVLSPYPVPDVFKIGNDWYMLSGLGDGSGTFRGYAWTGTSWVTNLTINASLPAIAQPSVWVFHKDSSDYLIAGVGASSGGFKGYVWNGAGWTTNLTINASLPTAVNQAHPTIFYMPEFGKWFLISGLSDGNFNGFIYNNSDLTWYPNTTIVAGLPDQGTYSKPTVFYKDSSWYLISGSAAGTVAGYTWNLNTWAVNTTINSSLLNIGAYNTPFVFFKDENWFMLEGLNAGGYYGYVYNQTYTSGGGGSTNIAPNVTLTSPIDYYNTTNKEVTFIIIASDDQLLQNVSLYIDGVLNSTDTTAINGTYTFIKNMSIGSHNWSILAFDTSSLSNQSDTWNINIYNISGMSDGLKSGLIVYYAMEETDGITAIDSIKRQNGTLQNTTVGFTNCVIGKCFNLSGNGTAGKISLGSLTDTSTNYTWSAWVNIPNALLKDAAYDIGFFDNYLTAQRIAIQLNSSNTANHIGIYDGSWRDTGVSVITNQWTHYVIIVNTSGYMVFVNGVYAGLASSRNAHTMGGSTVNIGDVNGARYVGFMDEFGLWNRSLTQTEITELYNNGLGVTYNATPYTNTNPNVTLNGPADYYNTSTTTVTFNVTVTDDNAISIVYIFIDAAPVDTNSSQDQGLYYFTRTLTTGLHNWSIVAEDTDGLYNYSDVRNINITEGLSGNLLDGLLVYYPMEETSGTTAIDSMNRQNGTLFNVSTGFSGKVGKCYNFTGSNAQINISGLTDTSTNYTIGAWVYPINFTNKDFAFFDADPAGTPRYAIQLNSSSTANHIGVYSGLTGGWRDLGVTANTTAAWSYYIFIVNSTGYFVYINGVYAGLAASREVATMSGHIDIGEVAGAHFTGMMDEFGIWNRSLTQDEINQLWNNGNGISFNQTSTNTTNLTGPIVNLISQIDNYNATTTVINFTSNETAGSYNLLNATLYVWFSNGTLANNITGGHAIGAMWTANDNSLSVTKMFLNGTFNTYSGFPSPLVSGITFDGTNIWVTSYGPGTPSVSKVMPNGTVTSYYGVDTWPVGITWDGVNAVWTANDASSSVSKVFSNGTIINYGGLGTRPIDLALDDVGNMWVANAGNGNRVVSKVFPNGTVTNYILGTGSGFSGIAWDGQSMWASSFEGHMITRMFISSGVYNGTYTDYAAGNGAYEAALDTNTGCMWVVNYWLPGGVTKVCPNGTTTSYTGTGRGPNGIAFDGSNMWIAAWDSHSIFKVFTNNGTITQYDISANAQMIVFDGAILNPLFTPLFTTGTATSTVISGLTNATTSWIYDVLISDNYTWNVRVCDSANNCSFASNNYTLNVNVDTTKPTINIVYPKNETYTVNVTNITYTISDAHPSYCWYSIDNGITNKTAVSAGDNFTMILLADINNNWVVWCNDTAGNLNKSSSAFTLNLLPPPGPITPPNPPGGGGGSPAGTITVLDLDKIKIETDDVWNFNKDYYIYVTPLRANGSTTAVNTITIIPTEQAFYTTDGIARQVNGQWKQRFNLQEWNITSITFNVTVTQESRVISELKTVQIRSPKSTATSQWIVDNWFYVLIGTVIVILVFSVLLGGGTGGTRSGK